MSKAKPVKSAEELSTIILSRLKPHQTGQSLSVVIAAVVNPNNEEPNWRVAFTTRSRRAVPSIAWQIASQVTREFDLG